MSVCCIQDRSTRLREPRGLRAKTDRLDATTIARALRETERHALALFEAEEVATYREVVRLQQQLTEDIVRYKNEIHALVVVLFPEFYQVAARPSRPSALTVRNRLSFCPGDEPG